MRVLCVRLVSYQRMCLRYVIRGYRIAVKLHHWSVALIAGYEVDVEVEHNLTGRGTVGLHEVDTVSVEDLDEPSAHVVDGGADIDQRLRAVVRHDVRHVQARDDQRVALPYWGQIEKRDGRVVFVDPIRGRSAGCDRAEDA